LEITHHTAQYFASQMLNLDWVKHGAGTHRLYPARGDVQDEIKQDLITAYAVKRPDGEWSLLIINKDPSNAHEMRIGFEDGGRETVGRFTGPVRMVTFGAAEYVWRPMGPASHPDPDGPPKRSTMEWKDGQKVQLPKASITVLTGKVDGL